MRRSRHTEEEIVQALKSVEVGVSIDLCRKMGVSRGASYRWRAKYSGMEVSHAKRLKSLEKENGRLKSIVADLTLDKQMLKEVLSRKW